MTNENNDSTQNKSLNQTIRNQYLSTLNDSMIVLEELIKIKEEPKLSQFAQRKKEMYDFIEQNTIAKNDPERIYDEYGNNNVFKIKNNRSKEPFLLYVFSGPKEFEDLVGFKKIDNPFIIDTDRLELQNMLTNYIDFVVESNHKKLLFGNIFLQSETDFKQADLFTRQDLIVNKQGFNKQVLGTKSFPKPFFDLRKLSQPELIAWTLNQNKEGYNVELRKSIYLKDLLYYNINKHLVEQVSFLNWDQYRDYKRYQTITECPVCSMGNGFNHDECKSNPEINGKYIAYVIDREEARYRKRVVIPKNRTEKIVGSNSLQDGLRFKKVELNKSFLEKYGSNKQLPNDKYYIIALK
jgi:hypothetical protein